MRYLYFGYTRDGEQYLTTQEKWEASWKSWWSRKGKRRGLTER